MQLRLQSQRSRRGRCPPLARPPVQAAAYNHYDGAGCLPRCFAAQRVGVLASMSVLVVIDQGLTSICHPALMIASAAARTASAVFRSSAESSEGWWHRSSEPDQLGHRAGYNTGFTDASVVVVIASTAAKSSSAMVRSASVMA